MRRIILTIFISLTLTLPTAVMAVGQTVEDTIGTVKPPPALDSLYKKGPTGLASPTEALGRLMGRALQATYAIAGLIVLWMIIIGAFNWITSGGDKDKVKNARSKIYHAIIGLAILAFAGLITETLSKIFNIPSIFGIK